MNLAFPSETGSTALKHLPKMIPTMLRPSVKQSVAQQDRQALHRIRQRQIKARTALVNQSRGLLAEYGVVRPKGVAQVRQKLPFILEDAENGLTMLAREWLQALAAELQAVDQRIRETNTQIQRVFASHDACQR